MTSRSDLSLEPDIKVLSDGVTEISGPSFTIKAGKRKAAKIAWQVVDASITGPAFNFTEKVYQNVSGALVCPTDAPDVQVRPKDAGKLMNGKLVD